MDTPRETGKEALTPGSPKTDHPALTTTDNGNDSENKLEIDESVKTAAITPDLPAPPLDHVRDHGFHVGGNPDLGTIPQENEGVQVQMSMDQIPPPHGQFFPQLNQPMQSGIVFPSIEKVVEFRYDLVGMTQFQEHRTHELAPYTSFNLGPNNPQVFVVVESCSHYYSQPACIYIAGEWVPTTILIPVAQHICVSLDDGIKRYEEIIKVDLLKAAHPSEPHVGFLTSIEHRVVRGNPSHRPRFGDILRRSLTDSMRQLTDMQFEFLVNRPTGRNVGMDYRLTSFFNESRPGSPYELHVNPLVQHVPQHLDLPLAGVRYRLAGLFYRPFVGYASLLLSRADIQIFETLSLNMYPNDRKIVAVAFDSAMVRIVGNPDGSPAVSLIDAASYSEFGPICSGLSVLSHNPRVPHPYHPFCNLSQNVIFNRGLNPFHSFTFNPPVSIPGHPSVPFFPAPYGYPFGLQMHPGLVHPQQPLFLPFVDSTNPPRDNGSQSGLDHRTPIQSPREKKTTAKESTTKLNPNARDFYPQGYHSLVATPFPVQTGPEEITITHLQTESEDQVILSSSMPCPTLSVDELEALQIHSAEKSSSSEISMLVNRTGFLNQSESHCSLYDPDTTIEIRSSANQNQYSWSEQVENDEKADSVESRGAKVFRGGYRGYNQQEEWRGGNKFSNYRWRPNCGGEPVDPNSQDQRLGHGFNNRTNFNQTRGPHENDRGNWRFPRGRGGRGRGAYGHHDYDQDRRRGNPSHNHRGGGQPGETGQARVFHQDACEVFEPREVCSDSDEVQDKNRREKTPVSYAAAARTNVPEDQLKVPAKAQIFTPTLETVKSRDDQDDRYKEPGYGYRSEYRPTSIDPTDNPPFRPHRQDTREYNDQQQTAPFRKNYYNKYPPRESWNAESGEGSSDRNQRGGRFPAYNNRYQRNFQAGKYPRRGSGRHPNHQQDVLTPNDFPPLSSVKPPREAKDPAIAKTTKPSSRGSLKSRVKKFKKYENGSGSSEDFGKYDNYLSDVIPSDDKRSEVKEREVKEEAVEDDKEESEFDIPVALEIENLNQEIEEEETYDDEKENRLFSEDEGEEDAQGDGIFLPEKCEEKGEMDLKVIDEHGGRAGMGPGSKDSMENGVETESKNECHTDVEAGGEPRE